MKLEGPIMKWWLVVYAIFTVGPSLCTAQDQTVGTLVYNPELYADGYTLVFPHNQHRSMLLNGCGEVVHSWELAENRRPGNVSYLMDNGDLVISSRPANVSEDVIWAGGGGATVERRSWENEVIWTFTLNDSTARLHHDIEVLPNGNVLAICWERIDSLSAIEAGRDPLYLQDGVVWSDKIIELEPTPDGSAEIVWDWRAWEHVVQDFDSTKSNFGVVADSPQRIDVNFGSGNASSSDWLHMNSIDYYGYYDLGGHILLSVPTFNEVWMIWHDYSPEEELIWRWGNPAAYDRGDTSSQKLFYQHDAHWGQSDVAITPGNPEFTKICMFNNRVPNEDGTTHSEVCKLNLVFDEYEGGYDFDAASGTWGPEDFSWIYTEEGLSSTGLSSFQLLGNDAYLICSGRTGELLENSSDGTRAWEYKMPLIGGFPVEQGTALEVNQNLTFRAYRYPSDYGAFAGQDLTGGVPIELNPIPVEACAVNIQEEASEVWSVYPNPGGDIVQVQWPSPALTHQSIGVFDVQGRLVLSEQVTAGSTMVSLNLSAVKVGVYTIRGLGQNVGESVRWVCLR